MSEWQPIETAPKDRMIVARELHNTAKRTKRVQWREGQLVGPDQPGKRYNDTWVSMDGGIMLPFMFDEWTEYDESLMPPEGWAR